MDFESFDLENLNTENSSMGYDTRKKIKSMLIGLINEGQKLIKETETKRPVAKPTVVVKNVRVVPKGLTINHKKSPKHEEITPEINFLCGICKSRFKGISLLSQHSKVCKSSKHKTDLPSTIKDCQNLNPGKQFNFNCGICKRNFETFDQLSKHSKECKPMNLEVENIEVEDDFNDIHDSSDNDDQITNPDPLIERSFKCGICETNFETYHLLAEHSKGCKSINLEDDFNDIHDSSDNDDQITNPEPLIERSFKCEICENNFETHHLLTEHSKGCKSINLEMEVVETTKLFKLKSGKYCCSICKKCFENVKPGMLHIARHYPNFKFVKKGEKVITNSKVKTIKHQIKSVVFKCSTCLKNFSNYSNLTEHKLTHKQESTKEDETPIQVSEELKKKLQESINLRKELNASMPRSRFTRHCKICDKKFHKNLKDFNKHIHTEHKSVETFQCKVCEKITFTKIALDSHMLLGHTDLMAKKYQCEKCDHVPFTKETMLNNHLARKHADHTKVKKTNVCEICGKILSDISSKERHVAHVHENKILFVCEYCGQGFKTSDRESHYRTHTGERPFSCDQCDSKFRHRQDLLTHKRLHTGERPFECKICHQRFIASTNLNKHLKSRHVVSTGILI